MVEVELSSVPFHTMMTDKEPQDHPQDQRPSTSATVSKKKGKRGNKCFILLVAYQNVIQKYTIHSIDVE